MQKILKKFRTNKFLEKHLVQLKIYFDEWDCFINYLCEFWVLKEEINSLKRIKTWRAPSLYFLINYEGLEIVYIGKSISIFNRLSEHKIRKEFSFVFVIQYKDDALLDRHEKTMIACFKPKYNRALYFLDCSNGLENISYVYTNV